MGLLVALCVSFSPELAFFNQYKSMFDFNENAALFTKISLVVTLLIFFLGGFAFNNHRSHQSELYSLMLFSLISSNSFQFYKFSNTIFRNRNLIYSAICNGWK